MIIGSSILFSNKNVLLKLIKDYLTLLKIYLIHQSVFTHIYGGGDKVTFRMEIWEKSFSSKYACVMS